MIQAATLPMHAATLEIDDDDLTEEFRLPGCNDVGQWHKDSSTRPQSTTYADHFNHIIRNESEDTKQSLVSTLGRLLEHDDGYATACSGSEVVSIVFFELLNWFNYMVGAAHKIHKHWHHVFACEIDALKQAWITEHFKPDFLFTDINALGKGYALDALTSWAHITM